jgi:hypothetical protein
MAEALQHDQASLIARISTAGATDNEPVPDTARSGRANAIVSQPRWYKKSVRSGRQTFVATLGLENGNGGYQVSQIGAGLVKASLVFADCLADLIALPAQGGDGSDFGHASFPE